MCKWYLMILQITSPMQVMLDSEQWWYKRQSKVICYGSRSLTDVEKKYSTTEKKALYVVWACEKFHLYLYGINFELVTDHKPLEGLYNAKSKPNARIQRWVLRLMPYNYTICYIKWLGHHFCKAGEMWQGVFYLSFIS